MPTLAAQNLTLLDHAKRLDPNGSHARVVEILSQSNPMLEDMVFIEGNLPTGHRTTIRTGLPAATWRKLYQGVQPTKSKTAQVDDACGMLEARSHVDEKLAKMAGNLGEFRLGEASAHMEGMNQDMMSTVLYGDSSVNPERFNGLAARYNQLNQSNADSIIDAGGTGADNTSIWLVVWGPQTVCGIYPKGSTVGLQHQDLGLDDVNDADGNPFRAYKDLYQWDCGISVRDWRYVVRIPNIDKSDLADNSGSQANLINLMTKAMNRIPNMGMGKACFYVNRTVSEMLHIQANEKANVQLRAGEEEGKPKVSFGGIPIRKVDAILSNEARVV